MKKMLLVLAVLAATVLAAHAMCPSSVTCDLDGMYMQSEGCYWNGMHQTCKFGHTHYGPNGPEHHYVMVNCD